MLGWGKGKQSLDHPAWEIGLGVRALFQAQWKATERVLSEGQTDGTRFYFERVWAQMCGPVTPRGSQFISYNGTLSELLSLAVFKSHSRL